MPLHAAEISALTFKLELANKTSQRIQKTAPGTVGYFSVTQPKGIPEETLKLLLVHFLSV